VTTASGVPENELAAETAAADQRNEAWLVYDGDCPFCSRYVRYVRFRDAVGKVDLVNAREGGPLVDEMVGAGLNLDQDMVLKMGGRLSWCGLHQCGGPAGERFRCLQSDQRRRLPLATLPRLLYPVLRAGRNAVLRGLGWAKIRTSDV
jgi:hypothetical protein